MRSGALRLTSETPVIPVTSERNNNSFVALRSIKLAVNYLIAGYSTIPRWWIGLEDRDNDGEFKWQDGTPVTFVDWAEHQPADVYGITNCVVMTSLVNIMLQ